MGRTEELFKPTTKVHEAGMHTEPAEPGACGYGWHSIRLYRASAPESASLGRFLDIPHAGLKLGSVTAFA